MEEEDFQNQKPARITSRRALISLKLPSHPKEDFEEIGVRSLHVITAMRCENLDRYKKK